MCHASKYLIKKYKKKLGYTLICLFSTQCSGLWYLSFVQIALSWSVRNPDVWWWSISQNSFSIFLHLYSIEMASYRSCFVCKYLLYSTTTNHDAIRLSKLGQSEPITQLLFLFTYTQVQNVWSGSKSVVAFGLIKILTHPC